MRTLKTMININELVSGANTIAISAHVRPDGDAVGSTLGLYNYIKNNWPDKKVTVFLEKPEEIYSYLKGYEEIVTLEKKTAEEKLMFPAQIESYDLFFALDVGDVDRLGEAAAYFEAAKKTVGIDHHVSNKGLCETNYIEADASSTAELVYTAFDEDKVDVEVAKCIYTGIIHDTGVFQYSCTSKRTMEIAGKLITYGFDFTAIINKTFYERTYKQNLILGRAVMESIRFMDKRCIAAVVDHRVMDFYGVTSADLQGIVNQLLLTKGVECAIFMYESDPHTYKVSMRSGNLVDVASIATHFGGGGHVRAAGFTMTGTYHDILNNVSELIEKQLDADK